jgi:non-homologous end joining protein Ku
MGRSASVEKFVDSGSIDPVYNEASYYVAPDGKADLDVYAGWATVVQMR